ncbi:Vha26 [Symbiodinium sp. CCMP2456]|nr:Vha26 [Symbiodinium sp. CCMP2456]
MAHVDDQKLYPVYANVYDVTPRDAVKMFNAVFAHWWAPAKLGDVFHVGVPVGSTEWAFGKTVSTTKPGVFGIPPRQDTLHSYGENGLLRSHKAVPDGVQRHDEGQCRGLPW